MDTDKFSWQADYIHIVKDGPVSGYYPLGDPMFKRVDEDEALIVENGVYKQADVYVGPADGLYLKAKGGFVRLKGDGTTSAPSVRCERLHREGALYSDPFRRLYVQPEKGRKQVMLSSEGDTQLAIPFKC